MNIAQWSLRNHVTTWVLTAVMLIVGAQSFNSLSRLEDPEFTIKEAQIITQYPGASAAEVEEEVTNVIEKAVQQLGQLDYVESRSSRGLSIVKAVIKNSYDKTTLPQVWDELRRKVNDAQEQLPPGTLPSVVNDDFGDVYGIYLAITGEGFSYDEINEYAKFLQRELLPVQDVKKITLYGNLPEAVFVEMQRERMAEFGVSPEEITNALKLKNIPASAGYLTLGKEYIAVNPTGEFDRVEEFGDLLIKASNKEDNHLILLRDVATITRGYQDPPTAILKHNGVPAIGIGISTVSGGNVVTMGQGIEDKLRALMPLTPVGMDINIISLQSQAVTLAIDGFKQNLLASIAIVVLVLLVSMGLRSGLIIGAILAVTILGTFIFMKMGNMTLERISLGALVIALGMLVDNAIVVTDGMRIRMQQGMDAMKAAKDIVGQTAIPLLGATVVAVAGFAAIGTSDDSTGEYCRSLFMVILISLMLSWLTAVTITPLMCKHFLKQGKASDNTQDPYTGKFFVTYRKILKGAIEQRWVTIAVVVCLFAASLFGFGFIKTSFFPDSTRPQFYVDVWFPEGQHISITEKRLEQAEKWLKEQDQVTSVVSEIGGASPRFLLTYTPEYNYASFARILVDVENYQAIKNLHFQSQVTLSEMYPDSIINSRQFVNGPSTGGKIQLRLYGPDNEELRKLSDTVLDIITSNPNSKAVRDEWRDMSKVLQPQLAEIQARRLGIDRPDLATAVQYAVEGNQVGVFRDHDELLPIITRAPEAERTDLSNLENIQIWSPAAQQMIPVGQVTAGFSLEFENPYIWRRNRTKMLKIHADPIVGLPSELLADIKPKIERALNVDVEAASGGQVHISTDDPNYNEKTLAVSYNQFWPLKDKPGYFMAWGGEVEDSSRAQTSLQGYLPIFFGLMVLIVLGLFNSIKKTLVIWLTVPLALIGVTAGLLIFKQPFGFMCLLGLLSLSGMLIKNAIVLIDEIDSNLKKGIEPITSIVEAGVSRAIPVMNAAATTILGMIPLLGDAFFVSMSVTIMFGLGFATILTLLVVPVLYATLFRYK